MDEFKEIANSLVSEAFEGLTRAVDSMTPAEREAYAERNPVRIWIVAGMDEDNSFAISAN